MFQLDPQRYGPAWAKWLACDRCRPLGPGEPVEAVSEELNRLTIDDLFGDTAVVDRQMGSLCLAGLWLLYDFLDQSHRISQSVHNRSGSYWHAIMHRREPDYSNSKYWWRQTGSHAVFDELAPQAAALAADHQVDEESRFLATQSKWDPHRFVDLCQAVAQGRSSAELLARRVAQLEWELLFDHCYRHALATC